MSIQQIREAGYTLLADYLDEAPADNRYRKQLQRRGVQKFLNNVMLNGDFFQALLDDNLGDAVIHADKGNCMILYRLIKYHNKYSVADVYTERTIPQSKYDSLDDIANSKIQ